MYKFKGFTEDEIVELATMCEGARNRGENLSSVFIDFAKKWGRAKGSVRNFYYDLVKECNLDAEFCNRFFGNMPRVNKPLSFSNEETAELVRKIIIGKKLNKSVRKTIFELANGDERLALRYQNKYRNVCKRSPALVGSIAKELGAEEEYLINGKNKKVPEFTLKQLKISINSFVEKIALEVRRENEALKQRIKLVEAERDALRALLKKQGNTTELFFLGDVKEKRVN